MIDHYFSTVESCMLWLRRNLRSGLLLLSWGALVFVIACTGIPDQRDWIKVGQTTRKEIVERYGQPDLIKTSEGGETAIYLAKGRERSTPRLEIPTAQAGPRGTVTTKMEPINPGLRTQPPDGDLQERPMQELHIRYNAQGIVQELAP